jgi:hypothetical protein
VIKKEKTKKIHKQKAKKCKQGAPFVTGPSPLWYSGTVEIDHKPGTKRSAGLPVPVEETRPLAQNPGSRRFPSGKEITRRGILS